MLVLYSGNITRKNGSADSTVNLVKWAYVWNWGGTESSYLPELLGEF